jgi:hypothetical protein
MSATFPGLRLWRFAQSLTRLLLTASAVEQRGTTKRPTSYAVKMLPRGEPCQGKGRAPASPPYRPASSGQRRPLRIRWTGR